MKEYRFTDGYVVFTFKKKCAYEIKAMEKEHGKCIKKG